MDNLENMLQHIPETDGEPDITVTKEGADSVTSAIRQATGLNIPASALTSSDTPAASGGGTTVLTAEEAAQLVGDGTSLQKVNVTEEIAADEDAKINERVAAEHNKTADLFEAALKAEAERTERLTEALDSEEGKEAVFGDTGLGDGKVSYVPPMAEEPEVSGNSADIEDSGGQKFQKVARREDELSTSGDADLESLVPSYDIFNDGEVIDEKPKTPKPEKAKRALARGSEEEYAAYARTLPTVGPEEDGDAIARVVRKKATLKEVDSGRNKTNRILADQAFINATTKFKKDNFRIISVPLVNSGFMADIVGTAAVDLTQLYTVTDEKTLMVDYELEKMKVVMRSVVDTHPRINPNNLREMIHFADYSMMAYAHVAATLKEVELISTCTECGKDFHIICNPSDLLVNVAELSDRIQRIKASDDVRSLSLMNSNLEVEDDDGFHIVLGHPSYSEYVQYLSDLKAIAQALPPNESARIRDMTDELPFVRGAQLPNGLRANNLFQRYTTLTMMNSLDEVHEGIRMLQKDIVSPKFGVRKVKCPHCGKVNTNITYTNLEDLLFFHFTVTKWMKPTEESSENG